MSQGGEPVPCPSYSHRYDSNKARIKKLERALPQALTAVEEMDGCSVRAGPLVHVASAGSAMSRRKRPSLPGGTMVEL